MKRNILSILSIAAVLTAFTPVVSAQYCENQRSYSPSSGLRVEVSSGRNYRSYDRGYDRGYDQRYQSSSHRSHGVSHNRIQLIAGYQRGKTTRPTGWHTREWFERRGYDLNCYKHKCQRTGKTHRGSRYRGR